MTWTYNDIPKTHKEKVTKLNDYNEFMRRWWATANYPNLLQPIPIILGDRLPIEVDGVEHHKTVRRV